MLKGGEASSCDYAQKIKNNPKHFFTKFHQFTTHCFWDDLFQSEKITNSVAS